MIDMERRGSPVEILIVDDNPNDVELILTVFEWFNNREKIYVVWDGEEALDFLFGRGQYESRLSQKLPSVVFLDLKLPKINGIEVLREIRSSESTHTLPVVMFTSSGEERDLVDSYQLGVNSYVIKPVKFEEYVNIIRELVHYWVASNQQPVTIGRGD